MSKRPTPATIARMSATRKLPPLVIVGRGIAAIPGTNIRITITTPTVERMFDSDYHALAQSVNV